MNSRIGNHTRVSNHIEFPNYEADELVEIGKVMCRELEYELATTRSTPSTRTSRSA